MVCRQVSLERALTGALGGKIPAFNISMSRPPKVRTPSSSARLISDSLVTSQASPR